MGQHVDTYIGQMYWHMLPSITLVSLTKLWRHSPYLPCPMLHLQLPKGKHKLAQSYPSPALLDRFTAPMIQMDIGVPGMAGIPGVVRCSHITTNPGSAEQQDFGSLAPYYFIVYLHQFP